MRVRQLGVGAVITLVLAMGTHAAWAQTSPDPSPTPSESPSPTESPTPSPTDTPTPTPTPTPSPDPSPTTGPGGPVGPAGGPIVVSGPNRPEGPAILAGDRRHRHRHRHHGKMAKAPWGAYSTTSLVRAATEWTRSHDRARRDPAVLKRFFVPFPVGGLAWWTDTWGAPRYAGGYHPHHGQDLLCAEGTPLLAVEPGVVRLESDPLGGTTVHLERAAGGFWYYAHLSGYAPGITDGATVSLGQVLGYCGATGDATVSHLHFSRFTAAGLARNPMRQLVKWLTEAELRAGAERSVQAEPPPGLRTAEPVGPEPDPRWLAHAGPADPSSAAPLAGLPLQATGEPSSSDSPASAVFLAAAVLAPFLFMNRRVRGQAFTGAATVGGAIRRRRSER